MQFLNTRELLLWIGANVSVADCALQDVLMIAVLHRKPDNEIVDPPADFETWEHERLLNRGLTD